MADKLFIECDMRIRLQQKSTIGKGLVCGKSTYHTCWFAKDPNTTFGFVNAIGDDHIDGLGDLKVLWLRI